MMHRIFALMNKINFVKLSPYVAKSQWQYNNLFYEIESDLLHVIAMVTRTESLFWKDMVIQNVCISSNNVMRF